MTKKLTDDIVKQATYKANQPGRRCHVWDLYVPGFGLRVYPSGRKCFFIDYRVGSKQKYKTLGYYPVLDTKLARQKAILLLRKEKHESDYRR